MAASVDPLVVERVIGDVVDMFVPSATMSVYYNSKHVTNGCNLRPSLTDDPPRILMSSLNLSDFYTLVMVDPDAPSPSEPYMREWVHWIVVDIPGTGNVNLGREILSYTGPCPPIGIHRYILLLFKQKGPIGMIEQPATRANFNTRHFATHLELGLPIAATYFNAQKEPAAKKVATAA
ncbi:protein MOTHER of FT and TFL1-like [Cucurbita moschata]|uniref:Protein MOTHER of FT and TFL1-like n=1 Tax=Cucurbita moschata TaxID=3662 RepID=A0A6J1GT97_CUCMO|nr:protein MOTHER of FT and TFL1-like [Cucurbita moschata]